jgi:uncharacterized OB-fold protein
LAADVELSGRGELYSYTYVHVASVRNGLPHPGGYGIGEVDLLDGPRVQTVLSGRPDSWEIGMTMRAYVEVVDRAHDEDILMFCFGPEGLDGHA